MFDHRKSEARSRKADQKGSQLVQRQAVLREFMLYPDCVREKPRDGKPKLSKVIPVEGGENPTVYRTIFCVSAFIEKTCPTLFVAKYPGIHAERSRDSLVHALDAVSVQGEAVSLSFAPDL